MQRYFTTEMNTLANTARIKEDYHHIRNVMRFSIGSEIIVCDHHGHCYQSSITAITDVVDVELKEELQTTELGLQVDLAQALIRRERFEYVLQKATELGVHQILRVQIKHSNVKVDSPK